MTDELPYPYECPEHGRHARRSHFCPRCIGEACTNLRIMRRQVAEVPDYGFCKMVDRIILLLSGGADPGPPPRPTRLTLEALVESSRINVRIELGGSSYVFNESGMMVPGPTLVPRGEFGRVEIEAL